MNKRTMNHATLQRHTEIFTTNSLTSEMSLILALAGCGPEFIMEGVVLRQNWLVALDRAKALEGEQRKASQAQKTAHDNARIAMVRFGVMIRGEFGHDLPLLTRLNLQPKSKAHRSLPPTHGDQPKTSGDRWPARQRGR